MWLPGCGFLGIAFLGAPRRTVAAGEEVRDLPRNIPLAPFASLEVLARGLRTTRVARLVILHGNASEGKSTRYPANQVTGIIAENRPLAVVPEDSGGEGSRTGPGSTGQVCPRTRVMAPFSRARAFLEMATISWSSRVVSARLFLTSTFSARRISRQSARLATSG